MFSLSAISGKAKAFVDWLDRIPGFAAAGVGLGVGMFMPNLPILLLLGVAGVYVVFKLNLGNVANWFK